jgi:hypothetical protein
MLEILGILGLVLVVSGVFWLLRTLIVRAQAEDRSYGGENDTPNYGGGGG